MITSLGPQELLRYQPNRYPFLMIDVVSELEPGKYAFGYKNLTWNEWYFPVHFPGGANLPGALQLEAMAQMLTVAVTSQKGLEGKVTHALEHKVRFRKELVPGMRLDIRTYIDKWRRGVCVGRGEIYVGCELACSAEMKITIPEIMQLYTPAKHDKDEG